MHKKSKMLFNINICGIGFVGGSIVNLLLENNIKFNAYDIVPYEHVKCKGQYNYLRSVKTLVHTSEYDNNNINVYFICVPTPPHCNGHCDTSIVKGLVDDLSKLIKKKSIIIIKSTIPPGTTQRLSELYSNDLIDIVFCPEFLREASANHDMYNANFALFGIPDYTQNNYNEIKSQQLEKTLMYLFTYVIYSHKTFNKTFNKVFSWFKNKCKKQEFKTFTRQSEQIELFKYTINTFLAVKVWYFNEIYEICEKLNIDYQNFKTLFPLEPRLGVYGQIVPGDDNRFGYSKKCLPKEILAMTKIQKNLDIPNEVLCEIINRNEEYFRKKTLNTTFKELS